MGNIMNEAIATLYTENQELKKEVSNIRELLIDAIEKRNETLKQLEKTESELAELKSYMSKGQEEL